MNDFGVHESIIRDINSPNLYYVFVNSSSSGFYIERKTNSLIVCESPIIAEFVKVFHPTLEKCKIEGFEFDKICTLSNELCSGNTIFVDANYLEKHLAK